MKVMINFLIGIVFLSSFLSANIFQTKELFNSALKIYSSINIPLTIDEAKTFALKYQLEIKIQEKPDGHMGFGGKNPVGLVLGVFLKSKLEKQYVLSFSKNNHVIFEGIYYTSRLKEARIINEKSVKFYQLILLYHLDKYVLVSGEQPYVDLKTEYDQKYQTLKSIDEKVSLLEEYISYSHTKVNRLKEVLNNPQYDEEIKADVLYEILVYNKLKLMDEELNELFTMLKSKSETVQKALWKYIVYKSEYEIGQARLVKMPVVKEYVLDKAFQLCSKDKFEKKDTKYFEVLKLFIMDNTKLVNLEKCKNSEWKTLFRLMADKEMTVKSFQNNLANSEFKYFLIDTMFLVNQNLYEPFLTYLLEQDSSLNTLSKITQQKNAPYYSDKTFILKILQKYYNEQNKQDYYNRLLLLKLILRIKPSVNKEHYVGFFNKLEMNSASDYIIPFYFFGNQKKLEMIAKGLKHFDEHYRYRYYKTLWYTKKEEELLLFALNNFGFSENDIKNLHMKYYEKQSLWEKIQNGF